MTLDPQNVIVLLLVSVAALYLGRTAYRSMAAGKSAACGGCRNCAGGGEVRAMVSVESLARPDQEMRDSQRVASTTGRR